MLRASTTSAVLATLDEKLSELSIRTTNSKAMKDIYEKRFQATLKEVVDKQKEARNANKAAPLPGKSGPTAAGLVVLEQERERERLRKREQAMEKEKEEQQEGDKDSMDVDDPVEEGKGKGRK